MGIKTWVCALCSQDFTRKYSAERHSRDLHHGQGKIVRILDYVIGRIAREYYPADPLMYRSNGKRRDSSVPHSDAKAFSFPFVSIAHNSSQSHHEDKPPLQNEEYRVNHQPHIKSSSSAANSSNRLTSNFEEIRRLSGTLFPPQIVDVMLRKVSLMVMNNGGNESIADGWLEVLRNNVNTMEAFRHLTTASIEKENNPPLHNHKVAHLPESSRIKLANIEQILTPFNHPAFVWEEIKGLISRCNSTNDHTFLDQEIEIHKRNGLNK